MKEGKLKNRSRSKVRDAKQALETGFSVDRKMKKYPPKSKKGIRVVSSPGKVKITTCCQLFP